MRPLDPELQLLDFLIGHFRGEGSFASASGRFEKEVVGEPEAGGRYLSLRMTATYRTPDGDEDVHHALVIVGVDPARGALCARVFDDAGRMREHDVGLEQGRLAFADRVPHEIAATRARKRLSPIAEGYEEVLEVDRGTGGFEVYSTATLRRL